MSSARREDTNQEHGRASQNSSMTPGAFLVKYLNEHPAATMVQILEAARAQGLDTTIVWREILDEESAGTLEVDWQSTVRRKTAVG
jgi:hypothetical protein